MTATLFLEIIVSVSLQAALVVTATHWIGRLAADERTRSRLWTGCYTLLLALVLSAALLPHLRLFHPIRPLARPLAAEIVSLELQAGRVLLLVWFAGCVVSMGLFIFRSVQAEKLLRTCRPVDPDVVSLGAIVPQGPHGAAPRIDGHKVQLVSSPAITSPFCWQFHRPYIVIPESLLTYEANNLKFVLRHELAHLRTGHPIQVFLQRSVEIIFWFHPMVWWASHESALVREFVCDDEAVENRSEIVAYLKTLLTIVEQNVLEGPRMASLSYVRSRNVMAERARRLVRAAQTSVSPRRSPATRRWLTSATPILLAAVTAIASTLWLPINVLASSESMRSPWPEWTASALHDFGVQTRDYEMYDPHYELHELLDNDTDDEPIETAEHPSPTMRTK